MVETRIDEHVLHTVLRTGADSPERIAVLSGLGEERVRAALLDLRRAGLVEHERGRVRARNPAEAAAAMLQERLAVLREDSEGSLATVAGLLAAPAGWISQTGPVERLEYELFHGPRAAEDAWYEVFGAHPTASAGRAGRREAFGVYPDISRMLRSSPARLERFARAFASYDLVRALIPEPVAAPVLARASVLASSGVRLRSGTRLPSWFWADGAEAVALPVTWGDSAPTSIMVLRDTRVAGIARVLFERLWAAGRDVQPPDDEPLWVPVLRLLAAGETLEAASAKLGINPRTARRRLSKAMERYGAETLFALGVAWGEAEEERSRRRREESRR